MEERNTVEKDKFLGALIGTFVGDALGMPFEGWPSESLERMFGVIDSMHEARLGKGTYTDDTEMMISVAESLVEFPDFNGEDMAQRFLKNMHRERGYGAGTIKALSMIKQGVPWNKAGQRVFKGGSFGNGAAMRIAPVGVFYARQPEKLREVALQSSQITHAHPLGKTGALLQAQAVAQAFLTFEPIEPRSFLKKLLLTLPAKSQVYQEKLNIIDQFLWESPPKTVVIFKLGHSSQAFNSVPTSIYCFLANYESFEKALSFSIGLGCDTDTNGAMTGAIAGAYHGLSSIPEKWLAALEEGEKGFNYLLNLGERLFKLYKQRQENPSASC